MRMIVLGHCLASDTQLTEGLSVVSRTRQPHPVLSGWPGCYSLVVLLPDGVVLLTDPVGQFPVYSTAAADGTWFSSSAVELAARENIGVDHVRLATGIACSDVLDIMDNHTAFTEVRRLPPGHVVNVDATGIEMKPVGSVSIDRGTRFEDAAERLRSALLKSVESRVATAPVITGDFSGGIDSSVLMFLSMRAGAEVSGFTFHHSAAETDDLRWARRYAALAPELTHHLVPSTQDDLPYMNLVASEDEPHPSSLGVGSTRSRLRMAAEQGSTLHLVGEGGDVVASAPPTYLADLVRHGEVSALWTHCMRWARVRQCSPLALLRRAMYVATTPRRQALLSLAAAVERASPADDTLPWPNKAIRHWGSPQAEWLTRRARADLAAQLRSRADTPTDDIGVADAVTLSLLRMQVMTQRAVRDAGMEFGIEVHAPYLDTEVVQACLALPAYRRAGLAGPKPLLRAALTGLVPRAVLDRPTKGDYTSSSYRGVRQAAPALRELLRESAAADHGIVDPVPVRATLERAVQGLPVPWSKLDQVFAVELWLRALSRKVSGV
ncbi:asparagine synthase (glutamine-hydrolyzing) [Kibdelosporangium banguiense]|uniref:asparagine synthase (glutamine-hydrolyzing) n=1 Tax=Kibdelosporangium banguiense TaxID=1365924 RepID=A0ABS4TF19_9PSEU|nr:asparagine synthase (glutamine-hydrolyzing) [Kibdelosporangium banguiense]